MVQLSGKKTRAEARSFILIKVKNAPRCKGITFYMITVSQSCEGIIQAR